MPILRIPMARTQSVTAGKEEKRRLKACRLKPSKSDDYIVIESDNVINMMKDGQVHAYVNDTEE